MCTIKGPFGKLPLAVLFLLLFVSTCLADVTNGSFEAVQISSSFSSNPANIPGWTHTGDVGDALLWNAALSFDLLNLPRDPILWNAAFSYHLLNLPR